MKQMYCMGTVKPMTSVYNTDPIIINTARIKATQVLTICGTPSIQIITAGTTYLFYLSEDADKVQEIHARLTTALTNQDASEILAAVPHPEELRTEPGTVFVRYLWGDDGKLGPTKKRYTELMRLRSPSLSLGTPEERIAAYDELIEDYNYSMTKTDYARYEAYREAVLNDDIAGLYDKLKDIELRGFA